MENTSKNDTLMEYIAENLEDEEISYNLRQHKLRCNDHIINQAVCAFFFKKHLDANIQNDRTIESQAGLSIQELNP